MVGAEADREAVVARLSELITVVLVQMGPLRFEIGHLGGRVGRALRVATTIEAAAREAVELFPELRRVM